MDKKIMQLSRSFAQIEAIRVIELSFNWVGAWQETEDAESQSEGL